MKIRHNVVAQLNNIGLKDHKNHILMVEFLSMMKICNLRLQRPKHSID